MVVAESCSEAAGDKHSFIVRVLSSQGTFGREPQARPEDDRYLRAAIQEYDNIAKLGQIMREGPIKVSPSVFTFQHCGRRNHLLQSQTQWGV